MDRPSGFEFLEAFGGRFYAPVSAPIVGAMHAGWSGYDGKPFGLDLVLTIGPRRDRVAVRTALQPHRPDTIVNELLFRDVTRPFRFPVIVERGKARVAVDGRERVFTTYSHRKHVVATATFRGLSIAVGCRSRVLRELRLGKLKPDQFMRLLGDADQAGCDLAAEASR